MVTSNRATSRRGMYCNDIQDTSISRADSHSFAQHNGGGIDAAATVLDEIMGTPDKGIPEELLDSAECVAVIPSMVKIGFVFGGRHGRGIATCRTTTGWSAPAPFSVTGGSRGLQIGGEAVDVVMLVMNDQGMEKMLSSKFKVGADASAAAGPVGRHAEGTTDWKMRAVVITYSRARGAFAGLTVNGASNQGPLSISVGSFQRQSWLPMPLDVNQLQLSWPLTR
jgi:lipid-binding SYLF domain-containing protein